MKSKSLSPILAFLFLMTGQVSYGQWLPLGGAGFTGEAVSHTSIAVAQNDTPIIAYRDNGFIGGGKASAQKYASGTWTNLGVPGFSAGAVSEVSLTTDSATHTPYVALIDSIAGVSVQKYVGGNWGYLGATGIVTAGHDQIALMIAGNGTPYLGCRDGAGTQKANVMKFSGGTWSQVGSANFSSSAAYVTVYAVDHNGTPYAASSLQGGLGIQVQKYNGTSWVNVGSVGFDTAYNASKISIAIGANNQPYVALTQTNSPNRIRVWTYSGSSWTVAGGGYATPFHAQSASLTVSKQGKLILACTDFTGGNKTAVGYFNGSSWNVLGPIDFSAGAAEYLSVTTNTAGNVLVGYEDDANGYGPTVDQYQYLTGITETNTVSDFNLYPNPSTGKFQISFKAAQEGEIQLSVTNMMGQTVWQDTRTATTGVESIDLTSVAKGLYTLQIKTATTTENRLVEIR